MPKDIGQIVDEILRGKSLVTSCDIAEVYTGYEGPRPKFLVSHYDGSGMMLFLAMLVVGGLGFLSFAAVSASIAIRFWVG